VSSLIGIARMAAESPTLEAKRQTTYRQIAARSYLTRVRGSHVPFQWTLNPYRGCEFACRYCYARYTHEFLELRQPQDFERRIFAKSFSTDVFRRELKALPLGATLALGTATDPYQPAERRFGLTRRMLEVLAETSGLRLGITTKSDLVARDRDVLAEVARRHQLTVAVTITTADRELARKLEPLAPRPDLRLRAVAALAAAGIRTVVHCAPVLPLINDRTQELRELARAAHAAGAAGFGGGVLFLKPSAQRVFFPFLEREFPALLRRYRERYGRSAYLRGAYPAAIARRIGRLRAEFWPEPPDPPAPPLWPRHRQLELFV
jgi:DNA repair photolyase